MLRFKVQLPVILLLLTVFILSWNVGDAGAQDSDTQFALASTSRMSITVNTTQDTVDANLEDEICADNSGRCSLRAAVMTANALPGGDKIILPAGIYTLTRIGGEDLSVNGDLNPLDSLQIQGAGAASTVIDANVLDSAIEVPLLNSEIVLAISGITIQNANGSGHYALSLSHSASLSLSNSIIKNNYGGIETWGDTVINNVTFTGNRYETLSNGSDSTLFLSNSLVTANSADGYFSDIVKNFGTMTIENTVFSNNQHLDGSGGAIYNNEGFLRINNSVFSGNKVASSGGALHLVGDEAIVEITDSQFLNNASESEGGAINATAGIVIINRSIFVGNQADPVDRVFGNGGAISNDANMKILNSTINGNTAFAKYSGDSLGGGIFNQRKLQIINSTISGNSALNSDDYSAGGGIANDELLDHADTELINVTITGNTADYGGGIYVGLGKFTLINTVIAGNTAPVAGPDCSYMSGEGTLVSQGHNVIGNDASCKDFNFTLPSDRINVDAQLIPLADNGGTTLTHALQPNSPAINLGNPATCPASDQRNAPRIGTCDAGAFEFGGVIPENPGAQLVNGGFEANIDGWKVKNPTGDKVKCDKPQKGKYFAYSGGCAFRFKGGAGENSKIQQKLTLSQGTFAPGTTLTLNAFVNASSAATNTTIKVRVKYANTTEKGKLDIVIPQTNSYQPVSTSMPITGTITLIKVMVRNKSASGKVYIDDISLTANYGSVRADDTDHLPLPIPLP